MTSREDNKRLAEAYNEAMGIGDTKPHDELTDDPETTSLTITQPVRTRYAPSAKPMAMDTPLAKRKLILKFAIGVQPITRRRAGVIRVWPRDR